MKKTKLTVALMTGLLSVGTLAGCDYYAAYSPNGTLVSYEIGGEEKTITADDIFAEYYNDSSKYQSIFDAIKSIIVRNYFSVQPYVEKVTLPDGQEKELGYPQLGDLIVERDSKIKKDRYQATLNSKNNKTTFDKEYDKILSSKGVESEEELKEKYLDELKTEKFEKNYYEYQLSEIKNGSEVEGLEDFWTGYFKDMLPYHVSHILVKISDSSATNYYNGTVSESDCEKLYNVVNELTKGDLTFGKIANIYSDDTGSKAKYGDLGIMDYNTSYVNEFKLGVYAYENFYGKTAKAVDSKIKVTNSNFTEYANELYDISENDIPTVEVSVFEDLFKSRKQTRSVKSDDNGKTLYDYTVMENNSLVYPRNIIYNESLNKHSFAFITPSEAFAELLKVNGATGFHTFNKSTDNVSDVMDGKTVLSTVVAGEFRPILMVRAGTGDYQGIHFIVVNRDAFTEVDANNVTQDEYYTTYHTNQDGYPKDSNGNPKQTYVNFNAELGGTDSNSRADSFVSTLKSFDSDKLSKYIFKKYLEKENIKIADPNLALTLEKWITNSVESKQKSVQEEWDSTWKDYVGALRKENEEREKLMTSVARIGFDYNVRSKFEGTVLGTDKTGKEIFKEYVLKAGLATESTFEDFYTEEVTNKGLETFEDLYNVKGALCNDGQEYK